MADEKDETEETATEDLDQQDAVEEDLPAELPDDPAELKKIAAKAISQIQSAKQTTSQLQSETERLKEDLEEERTGRKLWYSKWDEADKQLKTKLAGTQKETPKESSSEDELWVADLIAQDTKVSDLRRLFMKDAEKIAEQVADRKAAQITQTGNHARQVVNEYPDLADNNSPLAKATISEMENVEREMPELSDHAKFELATRRSAARLGIAPKTATAKVDKSEETERERRRRAQGGPTGKAAASKGTPVITDEHRRIARKMNGGQDMPDKNIIEALKLIKEPQSARA